MPEAPVITEFLNLMKLAIESFNQSVPLSKDVFLLKNGMAFNPPTSKENKYGIARGKLGECYSTHTIALFSNHESLIYCEGYAVSKKLPIPIAHAWLCDHSGNVVDLTSSPCDEYFGIPFNHKYVRQSCVEIKYYGILENDYRRKRSILKTTPSEFIHQIKQESCDELSKTRTPR
jgi:hypothetical protein